jgi:hypothetical protein
VIQFITVLEKLGYCLREQGWNMEEHLSAGVADENAADKLFQQSGQSRPAQDAGARADMARSMRFGSRENVSNGMFFCRRQGIKEATKLGANG